MCARVSVCSEVKSDNERETVIFIPLQLLG